MANLNKVLLIGRLTRDPEGRTIPSGTKVVNFGFAVNNRRKNQQSGQWEEEPVFIDCEIWNRGESQQADRLEQTVHKGQQLFLEGHLRLDQWTDKSDGQKRSKLKLVVENFQYLEPKGEGGMNGGGRPSVRATTPIRPAPVPVGDEGDTDFDSGESRTEEDIPF